MEPRVDEGAVGIREDADAYGVKTGGLGSERTEMKPCVLKVLSRVAIVAPLLENNNPLGSWLQYERGRMEEPSGSRRVLNTETTRPRYAIKGRMVLSREQQKLNLDSDDDGLQSLKCGRR